MKSSSDWNEDAVTTYLVKWLEHDASRPVDMSTLGSTARRRARMRRQRRVVMRAAAVLVAILTGTVIALNLPGGTHDDPHVATATRPSLSCGSFQTEAGNPYKFVAADFGMTVAIPSEWKVKSGPGANDFQASDPGDPTQFVRFGAIKASSTGLFQQVVEYEKDATRSTTPTLRSYALIRIAPISSGSAETVEWEFTHTQDNVRRHAVARYWRVDGHDYTAYASARDSNWPGFRAVVEKFLNSGRPC